jgi:hypothetical protein
MVSYLKKEGEYIAAIETTSGKKGRRDFTSLASIQLSD